MPAGALPLHGRRARRAGDRWRRSEAPRRLRSAARPDRGPSRRVSHHGAERARLGEAARPDRGHVPATAREQKPDQRRADHRVKLARVAQARPVRGPAHRVQNVEHHEERSKKARGWPRRNMRNRRARTAKVTVQRGSRGVASKPRSRRTRKRGAFNATWFLAALVAIGVKAVNLKEISTAAPNIPKGGQTERT